jgi:hypothetical protein
MQAQKLAQLQDVSAQKHQEVSEMKDKLSDLEK